MASPPRHGERSEGDAIQHTANLLQRRSGLLRPPRQLGVLATTEGRAATSLRPRAERGGSNPAHGESPSTALWIASSASPRLGVLAMTDGVAGTSFRPRAERGGSNPAQGESPSTAVWIASAAPPPRND